MLLKELRLLLSGASSSSISLRDFNCVARGFNSAMMYCTQTPNNPKETSSLYKLISVSDPKASASSILDQWIDGGRAVEKSEVKAIIRRLRTYRRFNHALQLSEWMSQRWNLAVSPGDIAVRLDLVSKVHGLDQAEKYFSSISENLRTFHVYGALLNCYANEKSLEKAEITMQKMEEFGISRRSLPYNVMLNLYSKTGNQEKFEALIGEMFNKGISYDKSTLYICLNAFIAASDMQGMENLLARMQGNPLITVDWNTYVILANGYLKAGLVEKSVAMLKKAKQHVKGYRKRFAYEILLTLYASLGKKDEMYQIWNLYKKKGKIYNRGYFQMISSLIKLDDLDGAEKILAEWESACTSFDFGIPNLLIDAYCKRGLLEKAEACINRAMERGKQPTTGTWDRLATGYYKDNQMAKAVETMKKAILANQCSWKLNRLTLAACIDYLKESGDLNAAEEFTRLLQKHGGEIDDEMGRRDQETKP